MKIFILGVFCLLATYPVFYFSNISGRLPASIQSLEEVSPKVYLECLHALAHASTTPQYSRTFFHQINGRQMFGLNCRETDPEEFERFLFMDAAGISSVSLPIYHYKISYSDGGSDSTSLPRNLIHINFEGKDLYLGPYMYDQISVMTWDKVPAFAKENGVSLTKIQNEYIKKYETWLTKEGKLSSIKMTSPFHDDKEIFSECLEKKKKNFVTDYLNNKFRSVIPAYGPMVDHYNYRQRVSEENKRLYQKSWGSIEKDFLADITLNYPVCASIIGQEEVQGVFLQSYSKHKQLYESLHETFWR